MNTYCFTHPAPASHATDLHLIQQLQHGHTTALDAFYLQHRNCFLKWAYQHYHLPADQALDIYQDTMVVLYDNIRQGKLQHLQSSLKTYVFAIGKNLILKQYTKAARFSRWEDLREEAQMEETAEAYFEQQQAVVVACLSEMAEPYRTLLQLYYYQKLSMKEIAERLGYKNEDVAKSLKARCLKALKQAVSEALKEVQEVEAW